MMIHLHNFTTFCYTDSLSIAWQRWRLVRNITSCTVAMQNISLIYSLHFVTTKEISHLHNQLWHWFIISCQCGRFDALLQFFSSYLVSQDINMLPLSNWTVLCTFFLLNLISDSVPLTTSFEKHFMQTICCTLVHTVSQLTQYNTRLEQT